MVKIASYVFFDIETTGLPKEEHNRTKITELSFVVALREDLETATVGTTPFVSKLTLLFNPQRNIQPEAALLTGLTNEILHNAPIFRQKTETILSFLKELPRPVCLVAHNGNNFDYKIFLAEFRDINISLPKDLLCIDSLVVFRKMHTEKRLIDPSTSSKFMEDSKGSEDWSDLDISSEDWKEIDTLCSSFSDVDILETSQSSMDKSSSQKSCKNDKVNDKIIFKLSDLYKRLLNKEVVNAHRAEGDCIMLLECVTVAKEFLIYADKYCKSIHLITPLERK